MVTLSEVRTPLADSLLMPTGEQGRPTKGKAAYKAEHLRRCEQGVASTILAQEAKNLVAWFKDRYPIADQPTPGTVENSIRQQHNAYVKSQAHKNIGDG